jgi:SAM-dependent methyltransferase
MSQEAPRDFSGGPRENLDNQYEGSSLNYKLRWEVYKLARPYIDMHYEAARGAGLRGDETVLDGGCGDAAFLIDNLYHGLGHRGQMIGVDKYANQFLVPEAKITIQQIPNIQLLPMDIENLEFKNDTFDAAFELFSTYHADPVVALSELKRVVKPGGRIVIATSGVTNKLGHRAFELDIAHWLSKNANTGLVAPPVHMNQGFNSLKAQELLSEFFKVDSMLPADFEPQTIHVTQQSANIYYDSLWSLKSEFKPYVSTKLFGEAMDAVVKPEVEQAIQRDGSYQDWVQRNIFFCTNTK